MKKSMYKRMAEAVDKRSCFFPILCGGRLDSYGDLFDMKRDSGESCYSFRKRILEETLHNQVYGIDSCGNLY